MFRWLPLFVLLSATPAIATDDDEFDPAGVSIADAINCQVDVPTYNSFALAISGEDGLAARLGWQKIDNDNPFLAEYELPAPALITGHWATRRVAFTSSGVLAILDIPDPHEIALAEEIDNAFEQVFAGDELADAVAKASPDALKAAERASSAASSSPDSADPDTSFRKFMGQRVLADVTEPANANDSFGKRTIIARSISNVTSHPGKTLYGCSYRFELLDRDGNPL